MVIAITGLSAVRYANASPGKRMVDDESAGLKELFLVTVIRLLRLTVFPKFSQKRIVGECGQLVCCLHCLFFKTGGSIVVYCRAFSVSIVSLDGIACR